MANNDEATEPEEEAPAAPEIAFFITRIGKPGTEVRQRTDDMETYVLAPELGKRNLRLVRADKDPTPRRISDWIVQSITDARLIVADVTGLNANVFYELGLAHAFTKPVILLAADTESIPFDTIDQSHILIGDAGLLGARQAETARARFSAALDAVLADDYSPNSPVTSAQRLAQVQEIDDPTAQLVATLEQRIATLETEIASGNRLMKISQPASRRRGEGYVVDVPADPETDVLEFHDLPSGRLVYLQLSGPVGYLTHRRLYEDLVLALQANSLMVPHTEIWDVAEAIYNGVSHPK